jgi:hypothetical protein
VTPSGPDDSKLDIAPGGTLDLDHLDVGGGHGDLAVLDTVDSLASFLRRQLEQVRRLVRGLGKRLRGGLQRQVVRVGVIFASSKG